MEGAVLAVARAVLFLYTMVVNKLPWHFFCFLTSGAVSPVCGFWVGGGAPKFACKLELFAWRGLANTVRKRGLETR